MKLLGLLTSLLVEKYTTIGLQHVVDFVLVLVKARLENSFGKLTLQNDQLLLQDLVFDDLLSMVI